MPYTLDTRSWKYWNSSDCSVTNSDFDFSAIKSRHGHFQGIKMMALNLELERDA